MKILNAFMMTALLAGGAAAQERTADSPPDVWKNRVFTVEELKKYDGKEGRPAYVAVDGVVHDVSKSKYWKTGTHMKMHKAGADLSLAMHKFAPKFIHKDGKILEKMPKVGVMAVPPGEMAPASPAAPQPASARSQAARPKPDAAPAEKAPLFSVHKIAREEIGSEARCPVSGDKITVSEKTPALDLKGKTYYFSGQGALDKFKASPEKYRGWLDKVKNPRRPPDEHSS